MKQIEVRILQQSYLLACPEGHEPRLLEAVERVDTAMTRIRDAGKVRARERIAVLAALNLAFEVSDREAAQQSADLQAPATTPAALPPPIEVPVEPRLFDQADLALEERAEPSVDTQQRIDSLLQRLDRALGDEGRLL
ncbi:MULTISPECIES: cell division protein ZapA [unclassified Acidovorax]|uniref:cell division protein ZapA n=1 Tax=unclassified Acidovorax TaxID=2684926 RepID=UPI0028831673|nr:MULTISPECIES: cell division protein ZapA [unclassified Acidovorax]